MILVTGSCGFIGYHLCKRLLNDNQYVIGIDNMNNYYDPIIKFRRLEELSKYNNFIFVKDDLRNIHKFGDNLFKENNIKKVIHLAAQAGVQNSFDNPKIYVENNIQGIVNLLEVCKDKNIEHFIYSSSSSVYGLNKKVPFFEDLKTDTPTSIYAASKKSCELFSFVYSYVYNIPTTCLRFFSVYGPFGRPDMIVYLFLDSIYNNKTLSLYNHGKNKRSFTYVDDVVESIIRLLNKQQDNGFDLFNIGGSKSYSINDIVELLEFYTGKKCKKEYLPVKKQDVYESLSDIKKLSSYINFEPEYKFSNGIKNCVDWYKSFYNIKD